MCIRDSIAPSAEDAGFPSGQFQQVYEVPVTGGRPTMFSSMPMECISINKAGVMLYQDKKGYEDVYKRQATTNTEQCTLYCSVLFQVGNYFRHKDVYKRQGLEWSFFKEKAEHMVNTSAIANSIFTYFISYNF